MKRALAKPALFAVVAVLLVQACAGPRLITTPAEPSEVRGTFTALLYGCRYPSDVKTMAILLLDGARYPVEIYDLPTSYQVKQGLSAQEALAEANAFVRCGGMHRVTGTRITRIPDGSGGTIGFDVRALYFPLEFGTTDVLLVSYSVVDGVVRAYVRLDPDVERELESSGSDRESSGH